MVYQNFKKSNIKAIFIKIGYRSSLVSFVSDILAFIGYKQTKRKPRYK